MQKLMKDIKHNIRPTHIIVEDGMSQPIENYKNRCPYSMDAFVTLVKEKNAPIVKIIILFFVKNLS